MMRQIKTFKELLDCKSETHEFEVTNVTGNIWIVKKGEKDALSRYFEAQGITRQRDRHYLSSLSFHPIFYKERTGLLQQCGFDVELIPLPI